jgi:hypothetical protein
MLLVDILHTYEWELMTVFLHKNEMK